MTDISFEKALNEKDFYNFVFKQYKPSIYESNELKDVRFKENTYYSYICRTRCFLVYKEIVSRLSTGSKIIDLGFYPGTLIRELKFLLQKDISCYGAGLKVDKNFEAMMRPYIKECVEIELDPFYEQSNRNIQIPYDDEFFDAVIATEILEHLISPLEMIAEGARILKRGGLFLVTTPNVSHIGAVIKIVMGRSNYERLDRSPMYLQDDNWRGHIRFYDKNELKIIFYRAGLELLSHKYYRELGWNHAKWPLIKKIIVGIVDKIAPIFREGHFAIFQKK
jgi:SAM-dependent methyltransferase